MVLCHVAQDTQALPDPSSAATVSLTAPGRENDSPSGFSVPCLVVASEIALTTWNIAYVFVEFYVCGFGAPLVPELRLQKYVCDLFIVDLCCLWENISIC